MNIYVKMEEPVKQQTVCFDAEKKLEELRKQQTVYSDAIKKLEEQFKEETLMNQNISQLKTQKECEMFGIVFLSEDDMKVKYKEEDVKKLFEIHRTDIKKMKEHIEMLDKDIKIIDKKIKDTENRLMEIRKKIKSMEKEEKRLVSQIHPQKREYDIRFIDLFVKDVIDFIMHHTLDETVQIEITEEYIEVRDEKWIYRQIYLIKEQIHMFFDSHIDKLIGEPEKFRKELTKIKEYYELINGFENGLHLDELREICGRLKS